MTATVNAQARSIQATAPGKPELTSTRSRRRAAAITGAAAFLFTFAHLSPAAAQTTTRHAASCFTYLDAGQTANCQVTVPEGKRFVIESATVGGLAWSESWVKIFISTKVGNTYFLNYVPAGFQVLGNYYTWWSGALPGTIFGEPGYIRLQIDRGPSQTVGGQFRMTLLGYLEDI